ncbi:MYG1 exonuclease isoform X2 [Phymastichus coffea]|nr:MYG1 exonuclease isoform X2 [Phymastichus coffea]XP_058799042.1 MYG1 exonuclease isoform X2 [Phymastichus coffea]
MAPLKIGTHNGHFHCDEVLACYLLKLLPEYKDAKIERTRDQNILDTCDIVVDVGSEYDPKIHRYDHHMREFNESISTVINKPGYTCTMKLSSAGLIYCHFGHRIIKQLVPEIQDADDIERIFKRVYDMFIKEIDGIDNGIPMFEGEPLYRVHTDISSRVGRLNLQWNSVHLKEEDQFQKAMALVGKEFTYFVEVTACTWLPARVLVKQSIQNRFEVDPSGKIVELIKSVPWKEHLYDVEKELGIENEIKFVIFKDNNYRVQGIPQQLGSFICRVFLPEPWRGKRDDDLSSLSGIKDCVFVHSSGFIGGNNTKEGTLAMARYALKFGEVDDISSY